MSALKRIFEWYLGLSPADPGQGTAWDLDLRFPPGRLPLWGFWVLAGVAVVFVIGMYRRDADAASRTARWTLIGLRVLAAALLVLLLAEPTLTVDRTGLPSMAVVIDTSASMNLEDRYSDPRLQQQAEALLKESGLQRPSRLNLAKSLLTRDEGRLLRELRKTHNLHVYQFSESARTIEGAEGAAGDLRTLLAGIRTLTADGSQTRLGPSVRQVLDDARGAPPTALLLLTDGITTTGEADRLGPAAEMARRRSTPLIIVGIGSEEPARDVEVYDLLAADVAFVDNPLAILARLKTFGYEGRTIRVDLRRSDDNRIVATAEVKAGADGTATPVELTHTPTEEGVFEFQVSARPPADESNRENNTRSKRIDIRREQIRVLLVEGAPRWEYRHLKALLERDETMDLHVVLQQSDLDFSREDRTALPRFPATRDELFTYDVVILGDADPDQFPPGAMHDLRDFVADRGGGLILIAGEKHNPLSYQDTPLEPLVPIVIDAAALPPPDDAQRRGFRLERTIEGRSRLIFRLADTDAADDAVWRDLPEITWLLHAPQRKPGAEALAVHADRRTPDGKLPVIVLQRFGAGQVLFHATDELWRWRRYVEDAYYGRYWTQAIRSLCRAKLIGDDRGAELTSDRTVYDQGDRVQLRLRFVDPRLIPAADADVAVTVERAGAGGRGEEIALAPLPQSPGVYEGVLTKPAAGAYHAWVSSPSFEASPPAWDFRVELPQRELQMRQFNRAELVGAAEISRGRFLSFADVGKMLDDVPPGRPVPLTTGEPIPLWNRWEPLLLFAGLLSAEWILRKRLRLV